MIAAGLVATAVLIVGGLVGSVTSRRPGDRPQTSTVRPAFASTVRQRWSDRASQYGGTIPPDVVASWCDGLARRVRSGATLTDALLIVRPDDPRLRLATDDVRLGLERGRSLGAVIRPGSESMVEHRHLDAARAVIAVAADVGGSSAAPLDRVAAALRLRGADERERVAQAAQARMSSKVLTFVPLAVLGVLCTTDPDVWRVITTPIGGACIGAGLGLNAVGATWMQRMIGAAQR